MNTFSNFEVLLQRKIYGASGLQNVKKLIILISINLGVIIIKMYNIQNLTFVGDARSAGLCTYRLLTITHRHTHIYEENNT